MLFFRDAEARTTLRSEFMNTSSYEYPHLEHPQVTICFIEEGPWEMTSESSSDAVASGAMDIIAQHRDKPKL
ncbi:hypothetical protein NW757_011817 [Fusarium falciforme]|nr:hypothetical protein NW757_011817 [Fusarium falciforme]